MKRFFTILIILTASVCATAQNIRGSWDLNNKVYKYELFKISWSLPKEIDWERLEATGRNICFKAMDSETGVLLMLNAKDDQQYGSDVWQHFSYLDSKEYKDYLISQSEKAGVKIKSVHNTKCLLDGKHAIKTISIVNKYDPAYGGKYDFYDITYMIFYNNKSYVITMQTWVEVKNAITGFDLVADEIFKGIKIY